MLRIGIIGCGKMGKSYAHWFSRNPLCRIRGFYNRTGEKAETLASEYPGSAVYGSWESLIESDGIDVVGICSPSHQHRDQFIAAMLRDKHALCEKPMANTLDDCTAMVRAAEQSEALAMIGFQMRFHPVVEKVTSLLLGLGHIRMIEIGLTMYRPEVTWKHRLDQGGGVMKELSSHLIDLCRMWCGDVLTVNGMNVIFDGRREVEDMSACFLQFHNGAYGYIYSNYLDRNRSLIKAKMICEGGQLEWQFSSYDPADSEIALIRDGQRERIEFPWSGEADPVYPGHMDSFGKEIDAFVDAIHRGEKTVQSVRDGASALEAIDAAYLSSKNKQQVALPLAGFDGGDLQLCYSHFQPK